MSEVPLYMCLNFEYTVSPGLHYMYTWGSRKGRGTRRGGVASIKDVYSYRPCYEHRPTAFVRFLKKTGTDRIRPFS